MGHEFAFAFNTRSSASEKHGNQPNWGVTLHLFSNSDNEMRTEGKLERYSLAFVTTSLPTGKTGMNQAFFALLHCIA